MEEERRRIWDITIQAIKLEMCFVVPLAVVCKGFEAGQVTMSFAIPVVVVLLAVSLLTAGSAFARIIQKNI